MTRQHRHPPPAENADTPGSPARQSSSQRETVRKELSRRGFLKALSAGLLGSFFLPAWGGDPQELERLLSEPPGRLAAEAAGDLPSQRQGRVAYESIKVYARPSVKSREIGNHWSDTMLHIQAYVLGDAEPAHNRVWYQLENNAYAHSGGIQPVETLPNQTVHTIPPQGRLAEVSVPFTDAYWGPGANFPHAYRFYYATTHWVSGVEPTESGENWYRLVNDKWEFTYYALARHLRLVSAAELAPLSAELPLEAKRIEVNRQRQVVIAYEWDRPVFIARAATGAKFRNGDFSTPRGYHITSAKRPSRHMAAGNLANNGFDLPGVPWVTYFVQNGISFHGTYWHNNFGLPRSHGCVNLSPEAAKWIYRWTQPHVPPDAQEVVETYGTAVEVI